jgi:uncharacterized protein with PIN domain
MVVDTSAIVAIIFAEPEREAFGQLLGDCFSYSLAKSREEPLLFKGDDFLKTDIVPAWRP